MEKKISLILDKEYIEYCRINNIEDVEGLAKKIFQKGFTEMKYGKVPVINLKTETKLVESKVIKTDFPIIREMGIIENVIPEEMKKESEKALIKELNKNDLYDE